MTGRNKILLAAGGTGGHMFLAGALAEQLKEAGYEVHLATDKRGMAYVEFDATRNCISFPLPPSLAAAYWHYRCASSP